MDTGNNLKLHSLGKHDPIGHKRLCFHGANYPTDEQRFNGFTAPGLDQIGTAGRNDAMGSWTTSTQTQLSRRTSRFMKVLFAQFRVDAYNAFNHINVGNPGRQYRQGDQYVSGYQRSAQFPTRQLQFSLRLQF